jgi:hypothetical protein
MLTGTLGIRLVLLIGKTIPLPAPAPLTTALRNVQVTTDDQRRDGFQIRFTVGRDAVVDSSIVASGIVDPLTRVVIGVLFGPVPQVLIDGVVTNHELSPGDEPGTSTLTVTGSDLSKLFTLDERNEEYPNQPDFVIAAQVMARYATYGIIPAPAPTSDFPIQIDRIPRQTENDFDFLTRIAERNGFVFFIQPVTIGVTTAYLGPQPRIGLPQPAITVGMGPSTNATGLGFSYDGLAPVGVKGSFVEPFFKTSIPLPALPPLKVPPLALKPAPAHRTVLTRDTGDKNPIQAGLAGLAASTNAPDAVTAQGTLDAARYGHALRARGLVGVRGAGLSYDGLYYVRSVTHTIERGKYSQSFQLSREGHISTLPVVPT